MPTQIYSPAAEVSIQPPLTHEISHRMSVFYRCVLPIVWLFAALLSWKHPGDEYLLFILVCGLPGAWVTLLFGKINPMEGAPILFAAGMITLSLVGWAMDALRVRRIAWLGLYVLGTIALLICMLSSYPTLQEALAKNRAIAAYFAAAANMSLYFSSAMCIAGAFAGRMVPTVYRRMSAAV